MRFNKTVEILSCPELVLEFKSKIIFLISGLSTGLNLNIVLILSLRKCLKETLFTTGTEPFVVQSE